MSWTFTASFDTTLISVFLYASQFNPLPFCWSSIAHSGDLVSKPAEWHDSHQVSTMCFWFWRSCKNSLIKFHLEGPTFTMLHTFCLKRLKFRPVVCSNMPKRVKARCLTNARLNRKAELGISFITIVAVSNVQVKPIDQKQPANRLSGAGELYPESLFILVCAFITLFIWSH